MDLLSEKRINGIYQIKNYELKKAKNGFDYIVLFLSLPNMVIRGHIWNNCKEFLNIISNNSVCFIEGVIKIIYDQPILNILSLTPYKKDSFTVDIKNNLKKLAHLIKKIENPYCKKLINCFICNSDFLDKFIKLSGGLFIHHNRFGGLLEHTVSVMNKCFIFSEHHANIFNRDLLLTGAFLHDIGKVLEFSPEGGYTTEGRLLGHIHLGTLMVNNEIFMIKGFPKTLRDSIIHMIVSHHWLENGASIRPKTPEAMLLQKIDSFDAMIDRLSMKKLETKDLGWSKYDSVLKTDVLFLK